MTVTELIAALEAVRAEHGELPVARIDWTADEEVHHLPLRDVWVGAYLGPMYKKAPLIADGSACLLLD